MEILDKLVNEKKPFCLIMDRKIKMSIVEIEKERDRLLQGRLEDIIDIIKVKLSRLLHVQFTTQHYSISLTVIKICQLLSVLSRICYQDKETLL